MTRYAAFLRGINLGRRRVTGPELCGPFAALGFGDVASFLASGNVVFTAGDDDTETLTDTIARALAQALGYEVMTFLRTEQELGDIVERTPFPPDAHERSDGKLQVVLLSHAPDPETAAAVLAHASEDDLLELAGRELFWLPSGGISRSELDVQSIDRLTGPTTVRTANTVARLYARFFDA